MLLSINKWPLNAPKVPNSRPLAWGKCNSYTFYGVTSWSVRKYQICTSTALGRWLFMPLWIISISCNPEGSVTNWEEPLLAAIESHCKNMGQCMAKLNLQRQLMKVIHECKGAEENQNKCLFFFCVWSLHNHEKTKQKNEFVAYL